jgi:hypothetical protein
VLWRAAYGTPGKVIVLFFAKSVACSIAVLR